MPLLHYDCCIPGVIVTLFESAETSVLNPSPFSDLATIETFTPGKGIPTAPGIHNM